MRVITFWIFLVCLCICSFAQTENFEQIYNQFKNESVDSYNSFRANANKEYSEWMKQAWKQYKALPSIPKPKDESKPPVVINEDNSTVTIKDQSIPVVVAPTPEPTPRPKPFEPIRENPISNPTFIHFSFYGLNLQIRFEPCQKFNLHSIDNGSISDVWLSLSTDAYNNTIRDCLEYRERHNLSDWAYIQLIDNFSRNAVQGTNQRNLLSAYLLCQSGYRVRLGKSASTIYFLYASPHLLYDIPSFKLGSDYFYAYECPESELQIFDVAFQNETTISLWIPKAQRLGNSLSSVRKISSKQYPELTIEVSVDKNLIDFYNTYPASHIDDNFMTRWAMYANTPIGDNIRKDLYPNLRSLITGFNQLQGVSRILNLVQTGFVYEYDDKVWGHDRAFFSEETLYYPYCDCEDRSILFSRLIRDLFDLDVILVYYPGHLATAVAFTENVSGDYITINGKRYIVCDPTYIGAPVGLTMPGMDNKVARVIQLSR